MTRGLVEAYAVYLHKKARIAIVHVRSDSSVREIMQVGQEVAFLSE